MTSTHILSYAGVFAFYWVWLRLDEELEGGMVDFVQLFMILLGVMSVMVDVVMSKQPQFVLVVAAVMILVADVMIDLPDFVLVVAAMMTDLVESEVVMVAVLILYLLTELLQLVVVVLILHLLAELTELVVLIEVVGDNFFDYGLLLYICHIFWSSHIL